MKITKRQIRQIIREARDERMSIDEAQDNMIRFEQLIDEIESACNQIALLNLEASDIAYEFGKYPYDDELAKSAHNLWYLEIKKSLAQIKNATYGMGEESMRSMHNSIRESIASAIAYSNRNR